MGIRRRSSLVKKWCMRYLLVIIASLIGLGIISFYFERDYERLALQTLKARLDTSASFFNRSLNADLPLIFISPEIQALTRNQFFAATLFSADGDLVFSHMPDPQMDAARFALNEEGAIYKSPSGERLVTVDRKLLSEGKWVGTLRFTTSLRQLDEKFKMFIVELLILAFLLLTVLVSISYFFMRSMVRPLIEMKGVAEVYAKGQFDVDLNVSRNDEIGTLAEALRSMAQDLKHMENAKYQFLDTISHELRTPMTAILGWCDLLEMRPELSDKGLGMIKLETQRLGDLVSNLIAFSGIKQNQELKMSHFDFVALLEEILLIFKPRMDRYRVQIQTHLASENLWIASDRGKLKQVIVNLLDNAMKFSEQDSTIEISQGVADSGYTLTIRDHGPGIAPEHLSSLTQKYYRVQSDKPGMGLGLAIVKDLLETLQGEMKIESQQGDGTTVHVTFKTITVESPESLVKL